MTVQEISVFYVLKQKKTILKFAEKLLLLTELEHCSMFINDKQVFAQTSVFGISTH